MKLSGQQMIKIFYLWQVGLIANVKLHFFFQKIEHFRTVRGNPSFIFSAWLVSYSESVHGTWSGKVLDGGYMNHYQFVS